MSYCLLSMLSALIKSLIRVVIFSLHSRWVKSLPEWQRFSATLSHTVLHHLKGSWWERTSLNRAISSSDEKRRRLPTDWTAGQEEELGATGEQGGVTEEMEEEDMLKKELKPQNESQTETKVLVRAVLKSSHARKNRAKSSAKCQKWRYNVIVVRNGILEEITGFRNQIAVFVGLGASTVENSIIVILLIISSVFVWYLTANMVV